MTANIRKAVRHPEARRLGIHIIRGLLPILLGVAAIAPVLADTTLWRIGLNDGRNLEFTGTAGSMPATYTIPSGWSTQTSWPQWPSQVGETPAVSTINYTLASVPANGVTLTFKAADATMMVPELAVYSNYSPCGIIQIGGAGSPGWGPAVTYTRRFTRAYQIYIPAEFLVAGTNKLQLARLGNPYMRSTAIFLGFSIDYMQLDSLSSPAAEPIHGKLSYLGFSDGDFNINSSTIAKDKAEAEWMGVAYSNNPERSGFFQDLSGLQSDSVRLAYLQNLKALNMTVILDGWNCASTTDAIITGGQLPGGTTRSDPKGYLNYIFSTYGSYFRFYEICNEPTQNITNASQQYCMAVANYVNSIKPSSAVLAAPGYSFGGGQGDPVNWDGSPNAAQHAWSDANRKALDNLCGAYNGHNWGYGGGWDNNSLAENIDSHGTFVGGNPQITNGWDKYMISTECGSATVHTDFSQAAPANRLYSSALDRNLRANLATGDYSCVADIWNNGVEYNYLNGSITNTATWTAAPANAGAGDTDTRVKALRRLALAYATHGTPLHYTWTSVGTGLPLSYFRAVDTSSLAPIPGSGATSNKVLLSFVNFDLANSNTISVHVTMPASGSYSGVRYSAANTYTAARSVISFSAIPTVDFTETLGPGESVEYIIDQPFTSLSRSGWTASASVSASGSPASSVLDSNLTTRWATGVVSASGQWFQIDMGQTATLSSLDVNYVNSQWDYPTSYNVNVSADGVNWGSPVASGSGMVSKMTIPLSGVQGRFIRLTCTAAGGNWWSLDEVNASGYYTNYPRSGWAVSASTSNGAAPPSNAIDSDLTTRWTPGTASAPGQWFQIDMGQALPVRHVILNNVNSPWDYLASYGVNVSNDGVNWTGPVSTGYGSTYGTTIDIPSGTVARYIRINCTAAGPNWWSIDAINVSAY